MEELKSCPFCGADAAEFATMKEMEECFHYDNKEKCPAYVSDGCPGIRIVCNVLKGGCGASSGYAFSKEKAIKAWNRRTRVDDDDRK